jgi:hypothetical protein
MKPENPAQPDDNQGEGDRRSARHYNEDLRQFVDRGQVAPAAHDAKAYVERAPDDAARAERTGKRGPRAARSSRAWPTLDELAGKVRTLADRARPIVARAIGKLRARYARK